jgi:hypothetical protein
MTGWAPAEYLVTDAGGKLTNLQVSGAQLGIPIVVPEGVGAVVATPPVGAMVAVPPTVSLVEPIIPGPEVLSYVTQQAVEPVLVDGEVMIGATLPAAVPVYPSQRRLTSIPTSTAKGFWSSRPPGGSSSLSGRGAPAEPVR